MKEKDHSLCWPSANGVVQLLVQRYNEHPELLTGEKGAITMVKKLSKHGNSLALVIDRSILELLKIDEETSLAISTDGEALVVAPVRDKKRRKRFEQALASSNERYGKALKRLAE